MLGDDRPLAPDEENAVTHSFDKDYWDGVWQGDGGTSMSASPPNPHLVEQVAGLSPGTALEAGCGAGAEAIWLAQHGWQVTGADIAADALARAAERAAASGVADRVQWVEADLSVWEPGAVFDLVTTHYAHPSIPQLELYDRLASWVAPGGTLLVVGHRDGSHGHAHGHRQDDGHDDRRDDGPPEEATVTAASVAARFDADDWTVEAAEERERTVGGPLSRERTLRDVVVKVRRRR